MAGGKHKRVAHEEHENHERWLLTYADMITLLMLFFIILYSMSTIDAKKYEQLARVFQTVFGGGERESFSVGQWFNREGSLQTTRNNPKITRRQNVGRDVFGAAVIVLSGEIRKGYAQVRTNNEGVIITMYSDVLFEPGSDVLTKEAYPMLQKIGVMVSDISNKIRFEGHTDNLPVIGTKYNDNWELSSGRAVKVLKLLEPYAGESPERFYVSAFSDTRPLTLNDSPEGRAMNRRVDVVISDFPPEITR